MQRFLEYAVFFLIMILLQVFLFNNLDLSVYIHPIVYIAFIIMLPMETPAIAVLLLGLLTGVTMDVMSGAAGLNTIATLFTSFTRPLLLNLLVGKDETKEGGIPSPQRLGFAKFLRYISIVVFIQCFIFFTFESLSWQYYHLTLLRIVLSSLVSIIFVWLAQMLLPGGMTTANAKRKKR